MDEAAPQLNVLGEVEVVGSDGCFRPGRSRPGAVLALLVLHRGETVTPDTLLEALWDDEPDPTRNKRVQVNVMRLRRALARVAPDEGPVVQTRPGGYVLRIDAERIDACRFERGVRAGSALLAGGDPAAAARELLAALALWRGSPYTGYEYESFARADVHHLEELRLTALECWAEAELMLGQHGRIAAELGRLVVRHPFRERLRGLLMLALYRSRRQGDALAVYRATRATLVEELGIEPCRELRELERAILEQRPALELQLA